MDIIMGAPQRQRRMGRTPCYSKGMLNSRIGSLPQGNDMVTMRISPTEVQAGDIIYVFQQFDDASAFQECVAAVGVKYCELELPAQDKRYAREGSVELDAVIPG